MWFDLLSKFADGIGIIGVVLLLIAYYLLNTNKLSANSMGYQVYNFIGAFFILISLFFHWNTSAVIIEIAWMIISLIGMKKAWQHQHLIQVNEQE